MQLYDSWKKVLTSKQESKMWTEITFHHMTEESEGENNCINQHILTLRSQGLFHNLKYMYITYMYIHTCINAFSCISPALDKLVWHLGKRLLKQSCTRDSFKKKEYLSYPHPLWRCTYMYPLGLWHLPSTRLQQFLCHWSTARGRNI